MAKNEDSALKTADPGLEGRKGLFKRKTLSPFDGKLSSDPIAGLNNTKLLEKQPEYNAAECETEIKGNNNARIILGRDRNSTRVSGYGGKGHTRSGAIDIVVGLQGWSPGTAGSYQNGRKEQWVKGYADKNFGSMNRGISPGDAARIYISQRTNIDEYFDLVPGGVGQSVADSAIGMKADSVRIMARKGIKLVTAKNPPGRNSLDGKLNVTYGIDLIAGNRDLKTGLEGILSPLNPEFGLNREIEYLQPIPKGGNLVEYLAKLHENVQLINSILSGIIRITPYLCKAVLAPKMVIGPVNPPGSSASLPLGPPGDPTPLLNVFNYLILLSKQYATLSFSKNKMLAYEIDYLTAMGALYVNSRHNRTN